MNKQGKDAEGKSRSNGIPLPIQSFLWRQSEPFLLRKTGKLYDVSCRSFEHVLVDNKLQGLPPSLSGAIESITRWKFIDACLPHIMHCAALLLINRNTLGQADKLGVSATKLLHTLHWIFLEATKVCSIDGTKTPCHISQENIRLFIYLFAPIVSSIKYTDLTFRLSSGQQIWRPMWDHETPHIPSFSTNITPQGKTYCSQSNDIKTTRVTMCDAAVISCLLYQRWSEDGVLWGLAYLLKKLESSMKNIKDEPGRFSQTRSRSLYNRRKSSRVRKSIKILSPQRELFKEDSKAELLNEEDSKRDQSSKHNENMKKKIHFGKSGRRRSLQSTGKNGATLSPVVKTQSKIKSFASLSTRTLSPASRYSTKHASFRTKFEKLADDQPPSYKAATNQDLPPSKGFKSFRLKGIKRSLPWNTNDVKEETEKENQPLAPPPQYNQMQRQHHEDEIQISYSYANTPEDKQVSGETSKLEEESCLDNAFGNKLAKNRRWTSDTCLTHDAVKHEPTVMTSCKYVDSNGCLRIDVLLSVVDVVVSKNHGLRVIDACLQIVNCLHQQNYISCLSHKTSKEKSEEKNSEKQKIGIFLKILHEITKQLGCSNGCLKSGHRNTAGERLRFTTRAMMNSVVVKHRGYFQTYIRNIVQSQTLTDTLEFFHPLFSYCTVGVNCTIVKEATDEYFHTSSSDASLLENLVVNLTFGEFVSKCIEQRTEIYKRENIELYTEIRNLVQFVRLKHPSTFNRVLLYAMLIPRRKRERWLKDQQKVKVPNEKSSENAPIFQNAKRRARRGAVDLTSSPLTSTKLGEKTFTSSKPGNSFLRKSRDLLSDKTSSTIETSFFFPKSSMCAQDFSDDEDFSPTKLSDDKSGAVFSKINFTEFLKRAGLKSVEDGYDCGETTNGDTSGTIFAKIMKRKPLKTNGKESDISSIISKITPLPFFPNYVPQEKKKSEFEVDPDDICKGLKILEFLMDCCPPGTVPEASVLGSVMGLTSPVISRAVVLLQCAHFIESCSTGCWPRWMMDQTQRRRKNRKNAKLYFFAGKLFHKWGEAVAKYLEQVVLLNDNPNIVLGEIYTEEEKLRHRNEDLKEDFAKDIRVNVSGKHCPTSLQMSASNLLFQITVFLRDVYPHLPQYDLSDGKERALDSANDVPFRARLNTVGRMSERPRRASSAFSASSASWRKGSIQYDNRSSPLYNLYDTDDKTSIRRFSGLSTSSAVTSDERSHTHKSYVEHFGNSGNASSNTLAVPQLSATGGGTANPFTSSSAISFGSTISLGASSVVSEFSFKDVGDTSCSVISHGGFKNKQTSWTESLSWLNIMLRLANQQNFLCDHSQFCHPYCHKRMNRSCNRLTDTICNFLAIHEKKNTTDILKEPPLARYLKAWGSGLTRTPLTVLLKAVTLLSEDMFVSLYSLCWEMLLDNSKLLTEAAATLFLLCSIKLPQQVHASILSELGHVNPAQRVCALKKIRVLWENRNFVWKNAETKARRNFKTPITSSSFTLRSSSLGLDTSTIPDPPWVPHIIDVDQILAQNSSSVRSAAILATDTLSHYKQKELKQLLKREKEERAAARRKYYLTGISNMQHVMNELKKKGNDENEEDVNVSCRRLSSRVQHPGSSFAGSIDTRREDASLHSRSNILSSRLHFDINSQENISRAQEHHSNLPNYAVFPPCLAVCAPVILQSVLDVSTTEDGETVGEIARFVATNCLIEDPKLFIRSIAHKLTDKQEHSSAAWILHKLPTILQELSPYVAQSIFNQLIETVLHFHRISMSSEKITSPCAFALSAVVPFSKVVELKTLKQTLRKEQIDAQLLVISSMPGAKKLTVWNQGCYVMPPKIDVDDDSTFDKVFSEAMAWHEIPISEQNQIQLMDANNNSILCRHCYVRDFYVFRKGVIPELTLVEMEADKGTKIMTNRVVDLKLAEIGKLHLSIAILCSQQNPVDLELNASYIEDELKRLWSFPKKVMDAEFFLFDTKFGNEIRNLDVIQKYYWIEFISNVLLALSREFPWENDFVFFMHAWSAALVIHCEQIPLLRRFLAAVMDVVVHFSHSFTLNGYNLILPSMLRIYSKHYDNLTIRSCLELAFTQMLQVHRQPFLLQLFASAAPLLSEYRWQIITNYGEGEDQLSHRSYFQLLLALTSPQSIEDQFQIMSFVKAEKPLKLADVCLDTDDASVNFGDYFRLCVTVIAYQPENRKTLEMLIVMNSMLPCYLTHIEKVLSPAKELAQISEFSVHVRALLASVEILTRTINATTQQVQQQSQQQSQLQVFFRPQSEVCTAVQQNERKMEEGGGSDDTIDRCQSTEEFLASRDVILQLCTTFYTSACKRLKQLRRNQQDDIFNAKSHSRLAEIVNSLLKLLTEQAFPTVTNGLVCYIKHMLPIVDWSVETTRPALFIVLKRLERFFGKISKAYSSGRGVDWRWQRVAVLVSGLCDLLAKQPAVAHVPYLRDSVTTSLNILVDCNYKVASVDASIHCQCNSKSNISPILTPLVIKFAMLQSKGAGENLEEILKPTQLIKKTNIFLLNFIIPICLFAGSEIDFKAGESQNSTKSDLTLPRKDVVYLMEVCFNILLGKSRIAGERLIDLFYATSPMLGRNNSIGQNIALFTLKVVITSFHNQLQGEWYKMARKIKDITLKNITGPAIWSFMVFVIRYTTPLLAHLKPFVVRQFMNRAIDVEEQRHKEELAKILATNNHQTLRLSLMMEEFVQEARLLRRQLHFGSGDIAPSPASHSYHGIKSPVTEKESLRDRSRIGSFRRAMTPTDATATLSEGKADSPLNDQRGASPRRTSVQIKSPSSSTSWRQFSKKNKSSSAEDSGTTADKPTNKSSPRRIDAKPIPDITVDLYESPATTRSSKARDYDKTTVNKEDGNRDRNSPEHGAPMSRRSHNQEEDDKSDGFKRHRSGSSVKRGRTARRKSPESCEPLLSNDDEYVDDAIDSVSFTLAK